MKLTKRNIKRIVENVILLEEIEEEIVDVLDDNLALSTLRSTRISGGQRDAQLRALYVTNWRCSVSAITAVPIAASSAIVRLEEAIVVQPVASAFVEPVV